MRIAVVDDEKLYRDSLEKCLHFCSDKHSLDIEVDCYKDGLDLLDKKDIIYDIIYLDIKMNFIDGMETAREIRKRDNDVIIVFCTNYVKYAIDGYSVNAADFLLKPVSEFAFYEHFKKILPKLEKNSEPFIMVKTKIGVKKVKYSKILYLESDGPYVKIITKNEEIIFLDTLKNLEMQLDKRIFFRSNSCYIVNLTYVTEVVDNCSKLGKYKLQISRSRKKGFMEALTNFIGDDI